MYYKLARPDGWDFWTGNTINYRENIGKIVRRRNTGEVNLCSNTCLHASRNPNHAFSGNTSIPCSVFLVDGLPYRDEGIKTGFKQLRVLEELDPAEVFKWRYQEACNIVNPFEIKPPRITKKHINLARTWASSQQISWDIILSEIRPKIRRTLLRVIYSKIADEIEKSIKYLHCKAQVQIYQISQIIQTSVWTYGGYLIQPIIPQWKIYPFQTTVELWKFGLIPFYYKGVLHLYGGKKGRVLWKENLF